MKRKLIVFPFPFYFQDRGNISKQQQKENIQKNGVFPAVFWKTTI